MHDILLVTPPFLQPNAPYPATAYLKGWLARRGFAAEQYDLSVSLLGELFSRPFLEEVFSSPYEGGDRGLQRTYALRRQYIATIDNVMAFLRGTDPTLAHLICGPDFLPQGVRFEACADLDGTFGSLGTADCARYLATLYLQELCDYLRCAVSDHFELVRYAEQLSVSLPHFDPLRAELERPMNRIEQRMTELLAAEVTRTKPRWIAFTVPFPGCLLAALRCCAYLRQHYPEIGLILGGGYPTTELRQMSDRSIFDYCDYVVLDDGEAALERILAGKTPTGTWTRDGFIDGNNRISHAERGCPDFSGLPHEKYFSLFEVTNPMHRLWSDGRWNKMMLAHGCYWAKCAFCDTSLDYIGCYDTVPASTLVDWMEQVAAQTGSRGFHFVDEAAPPALLRELSLELLRRGFRCTWWTNIRFETAYTGDLCRLMAAAGCIAVSGGLEVASDRLLAMIGKGITIEQATIAMRNFYYAGILVHSYLMYGLPTQTLQESVDALEVVRQLFRAELIDSAYWHRYAMTLHSPSGQTPEKYGVRRKNITLNPFANNEIRFAEDRGYNINLVGDALRESLAGYLAGEGLERAAHKWFAGKAPQTTVPETLVTDHLIKPDRSRLYDDAARLVWIGTDIERTGEGLLVRSNAEERELKFKPSDADFLLRLSRECADLGRRFTLGQAKELHVEYSQEPFAPLYHGKKWDILRSFGLLQL